MTAEMEYELLTSVKPLVESKYRVLTDRGHRAVGGLSMGAAQSMAIGLHDVDQFAYIAVFSGSGNGAEWEKADPGMLNQQLKVLWLGCGTQDFAYAGWKATDELLTNKKRETRRDGVHSWLNWRVYLTKYAPLLVATRRGTLV